jgi:hypothetical protein
MIIIYSLIGALEKFPYLAIPFIALVVWGCSSVAGKMHLSAEARVFFIVLASALIAILVIVPSWLAYKYHEGQRTAEKDAAFMAQFPVSVADAITSVAARLEVADIITNTAAEHNERSSAAELSWEGVPSSIPATKDGFPVISYSKEIQGDSLTYTVYVNTENNEVLMYEVDAATGAVTAR